MAELAGPVSSACDDFCLNCSVMGQKEEARPGSQSRLNTAPNTTVFFTVIYLSRAFRGYLAGVGSLHHVCPGVQFVCPFWQQAPLPFP